MCVLLNKGKKHKDHQKVKYRVNFLQREFHFEANLFALVITDLFMFG